MKAKGITFENFLVVEQVDRPIQWPHIFEKEGNLDVEIGFGNGEFLTRTAQNNPQRCYVGIEQNWERICKTLRKIKKDRIRNIRILLVEAHLAFDRVFPPESIENIYCLFPCPWPKKHHVKHRLFSSEFLQLMNSRLVPGGQIKIVTDFLSYRDWILNQTKHSGFKIKLNTVQPQFDTKFERKWQGLGQNEFYEIQLFKDKHINVPLKEDADLKSYTIDDFDPYNFRMENKTGEHSVIFKEYLYDEKRKKAMVRLIVTEPNLTQNVWVSIIKMNDQWRLVTADGHRFIPTPTVVEALRLVKEACLMCPQALKR